MLKSSLCDYGDAYILVKGTITVNNTVAADADANNINKKLIFKNCAPFTNCISEINNTQIDNAKDLDIVMPMYNLIDITYICGNIVKIYLQQIIIIMQLLTLLITIVLIHLILK